MNTQANLKDASANDSYLDRRTGEDRRQAHDLDYFPGGEIDDDPFEQDVYYVGE